MPPSCQRRRCLTHGAESPPPIPSQHATLPVPLVPARAGRLEPLETTSSDAPVALLPAPHPPPPIPLLRSALLSDLLPLEVQPHLLLLLRVRVRVRARARARASARARVRARARARARDGVRDSVRDSVRARDRVTSSVSPAESLELGVLGRAADCGCGVAAAGAASSTLELGVPQSAL